MKSKSRGLLLPMQESVITTSEGVVLDGKDDGEQKEKEYASRMIEIREDIIEDQQMIVKYMHKKFNANKGITKSAQPIPDSSAWVSEKTEDQSSEKR